MNLLIAKTDNHRLKIEKWEPLIGLVKKLYNPHEYLVTTSVGQNKNERIKLYQIYITKYF